MKSDVSVGGGVDLGGLSKEELITLVEEKQGMVDSLNEHISERELEQEIHHLIATAPNGQKYELRFIAIQVKDPETQLVRRVPAEEVKSNPELLEKLIQENCSLVIPHLPTYSKGGEI